MVKTIAAIYDGKVLHPEEHIDLEPDTRVRLVIEILYSPCTQHTSFLGTARSLNLDGPEDWSVNFDSGSYGGNTKHDN